VYTPTEYRRHGYESALVADLSQDQLDRGKMFTYLTPTAAIRLLIQFIRRPGIESSRNAMHSGSRETFMNRLRQTSIGLFASWIVAAQPAAAQAQSSTEHAVRAVVDSFFDAVAREKWESAAGFIDLARFEPHFKQVIGRARSALPPPELTIEQILARDSTMPRAVAEYQLAEAKKYSAMSPGFGDMSYEFAGVHSQQDLFALKPAEALARWLEAQDERTQMREGWRRMGCSLSDLPSFPGAKRLVLGVAIVNDSLAYVVHADDRFGPVPTSFYGTERLFVVRRTNGVWRIEPRVDVLHPLNMSFGFDQCPKIKKP